MYPREAAIRKSTFDEGGDANFAASLYARQNGRGCLHALGHLGYRVVKTKVDHFAHVGLDCIVSSRPAGGEGVLPLLSLPPVFSHVVTSQDGEGNTPYAQDTQPFSR